MEETIVAQATPGGRGGIAVVRLSGMSAKAVGQMICGSLPEAWSLKPCSFSRCDGEVIDSGLVAFFATLYSSSPITPLLVLRLSSRHNLPLADTIAKVVIPRQERLASRQCP